MNIQIDGIDYAPITNTPGRRVVLVIDRGWIFAGDEHIADDGTVTLTNAVHVFGWRSIGYAKMLEVWRSDKVDLRPCCAPVEVPAGSVIFRNLVEEGWGKE